MKIRNLSVWILLGLSLVFSTACYKNEPAPFTLNSGSLQKYLEENTATQKDFVIACSASDKNNPDIVYSFYYPLPGVSDIRYYELVDLTKSDSSFADYVKVDLPQEAVFNGYLGRFIRSSGNETFATVTYERADTLYMANPIRFKQNTQPTVWTDSVNIDFTEALKPKFTWTDIRITDNVIYFQVISDASGNLLSGTYTTEKTFQYYNTDNVVLNVTRDTPSSLEIGETYRFTLMAVSADNWVNMVIQKDFSL